MNVKGVAFQVFEEQLECFSDCGKGYVVPGDLVHGEQAAFEGFLSGPKPAIFQGGPVKHVYLIYVWNINNGVKPFYIDPGQSFFKRFTLGSLNGGFRVFHIACRKGPVTVSWLDCTPAEQDFSFPNRYCTRNN